MELKWERWEQEKLHVTKFTVFIEIHNFSWINAPWVWRYLRNFYTFIGKCFFLNFVQFLIYMKEYIFKDAYSTIYKSLTLKNWHLDLNDKLLKKIERKKIELICQWVELSLILYFCSYWINRDMCLAQWSRCCLGHPHLRLEWLSSRPSYSSDSTFLLMCTL